MQVLVCRLMVVESVFDVVVRMPSMSVRSPEHGLKLSPGGRRASFFVAVALFNRCRDDFANRALDPTRSVTLLDLVGSVVA